jgi:hypothetical protein
MSNPAIAVAAGLPVLLVGWIVAGVVVLPRTVDAAAYLVGAGGRASFIPASQSVRCGRFGCQTVTNGLLEVSGHASAATWPGQVPLHAPFTVREPAWNWGAGSELMTDTGNAIVNLVIGVLIDGVGLLVLGIASYACLAWWRPRRRSTGSDISPDLYGDVRVRSALHDHSS